MWVKICANTSLEDALAAARFGADAVGFVFAPSRRQVTAAQVQAITRELPSTVETVGVFARADAEVIALAAEQAQINTIQLHGGYDPELAANLRSRLGTQVAIIHTAHWAVGSGEQSSAADVVSTVARLAEHIGPERLLVDAQHSGQSGGLGLSFDWSAARPALVTSERVGVRIIVAGGLNPGNVGEAITRLQPWGVDVASGVEQEPGRKDHALLEAFIRNAKSA